MSFTEFILNNHPDPDGFYRTFIFEKYDDWEEMKKLAQAYADAQSLEFAKWADLHMYYPLDEYPQGHDKYFEEVLHKFKKFHSTKQSKL
jgi:hypothetical protein